MPRPEATNSLVVLFDAFSDQACAALRARLETCGPLRYFAKLRSFERCLAVFEHTADSQTAMRLLNSQPVLGENRLRMYYSMHTPLASTQDSLLQVPDQEKLWLISPPGSPPIDWRQGREDPPNAHHLDRRLEAALQELKLGQFTLNPAAVNDSDSDHGSDSDSSPGQGARPAGASANTPTILIQHCDHEGDSGSRPASRPVLVNRPPTPGPSSSGLPRPTPRPPPRSDT